MVTAVVLHYLFHRYLSITVPGSIVSGNKDAYYLAGQSIKVSKAINDYLVGTISEDDFLDLIEDADVDPDGYLEGAIQALEEANAWVHGCTRGVV